MQYAGLFLNVFNISVDPIEVDIEDGLTCNQRLENRIVDAYLTDMDFEIFGLVDGSDSLSGMPTQLRFSYRQLNNELKWNQAFVSCVSTDPDSGAPLIDYDSFQKMIPCRGNVEFDDSRRPPSIFESMA